MGDTPEGTVQLTFILAGGEGCPVTTRLGRGDEKIPHIGVDVESNLEPEL
jgi:hypothetical protein